MLIIIMAMIYECLTIYSKIYNEDFNKHYISSNEQVLPYNLTKFRGTILNNINKAGDMGVNSQLSHHANNFGNLVINASKNYIDKDINSQLSNLTGNNFIIDSPYMPFAIIKGNDIMEYINQHRTKTINFTTGQQSNADDDILVNQQKNGFELFSNLRNPICSAVVDNKIQSNTLDLAKGMEPIIDNDILINQQKSGFEFFSNFKKLFCSAVVDDKISSHSKIEPSTFIKEVPQETKYLLTIGFVISAILISFLVIYFLMRYSNKCFKRYFECRVLDKNSKLSTPETRKINSTLNVRPPFNFTITPL